LPISVKAVASTSLGTGTTKTKLTGASVKVPSWAKKLLAIAVTPPQPTTPKTQISYNAKFYIESEDLPAVMPFVALCPPLSSNIATNTNPDATPKELYNINCPCKGGENLDIYGEMLTGDGTTLVELGAELYFSDGESFPQYLDPLPNVQRHCKVGTWTAAAAAAKATGTLYQLVNAKAIVEVMSIVNTFTTTVSKPSAGEFELTSSDFLGISPLSWQAEIVAAFIGTGKPSLAKLTRIQCLNVPVRTPCNIVDTFTDWLGLATDYWITGAMYI